MPEINARRVRGFEEMNAPGDFYWACNGEGVPQRLMFRCPCGCDSVNGVAVSGDPDKHYVWRWDGNEEKPTVTPSIKMLSGCMWHGFLTAGVFRTA